MVRILQVVMNFVLTMHSSEYNMVVNVSVVIAMESLLISILYLMTLSAITEVEKDITSVAPGLTLYSATTIM